MTGPGFSFLKDLTRLNLGFSRIFRVILMLTSRCPMNCAICGISQSQSKDLDFQDLETFFKKNGFTWLNLTGGEIFLREDMPEIFKLIAASQKDLGYLSFPTTGYLTEKTVHNIEQALKTSLPRIYVTISFDGGEASHTKLRKAKDSFDRAKETFLSLKKLTQKHRGRLFVYPGLTLSDELLDLQPNPLKALYADLKLDKIQDIHVNLAHTSSHYYHNEKRRPLSEASSLKVLKELIGARKNQSSFLNRLERIYLSGAIHYLKTKKTPLPCKAARASLFIDNTWTAYPCTLFSFVLGDLKEMDFDLNRLKEMETYQQALKIISSKQCPHCWSPCEAYTSIVGNLLNPSFVKLLFRSRGEQ